MVEEILYAPRKRRDELKKAIDELRDARLDATANGAIRYDKDRVMSSASDDLLNNKVARIIDAEKEVDRAEKEFKKSQINALRLINLIESDTIREVCRRYFVELHSCRRVGYMMLYSASAIHKYKEQGIEEIKSKFSKTLDREQG